MKDLIDIFINNYLVKTHQSIHQVHYVISVEVNWYKNVNLVVFQDHFTFDGIIIITKLYELDNNFQLNNSIKTLKRQEIDISWTVRNHHNHDHYNIHNHKTRLQVRIVVGQLALKSSVVYDASSSSNASLNYLKIVHFLSISNTFIASMD